MRDRGSFTACPTKVPVRPPASRLLSRSCSTRKISASPPSLYRVFGENVVLSTTKKNVQQGSSASVYVAFVYMLYLRVVGARGSVMLLSQRMPNKTTTSCTILHPILSVHGMPKLTPLRALFADDGDAKTVLIAMLRGRNYIH